jgi:hydroxymethylglutaryl-CoA lyase
LFQHLPARVSVYEVGPRDGLQNEAKPVSTDDKLRLIRALANSGLRRIEATSFVHPKWIPPLADADQLAPQLPPGPTFSALTPNIRGLERAIAAKIPEVAVFMSASETHSLKNINKSIPEAVKACRQVVEAALPHGLRVRAYLSTVWGCPYEGAVAIEQIVPLVKELLGMGCYEVSLGDTIGVGNPLQTQKILEALFFKGVKPSQVAGHFHDTRGTALANALTALELGVTTFDASIGGLGGCPYAPGAAGNLATEDLVYMLHAMGIETGIDLDKLTQAGVVAQEVVGRKLSSKTLLAALGSGKA